MPKPNEELEFGRLAFGLYNAHPPASTTHDGKPVPSWEEIPDDKPVKAKWNATLRAFVRAAEGGRVYAPDLDGGAVPEGDNAGDLLLIHREDGAVIPFRWCVPAEGSGYWHSLTSEYRSIKPGEPQHVPWTIVGVRAIPVPLERSPDPDMI